MMKGDIRIAQSPMLSMDGRQSSRWTLVAARRRLHGRRVAAEPVFKRFGVCIGWRTKDSGVG